MRHRTTHAMLLLALVALGAAACEDKQAWRDWLEFGVPAQGNKNFMELNPVDDMHNSSALKAQEKEMMLPAPMTISTSHRPYPSEVLADKTLAGAALKNPLPQTEHNYQRGRDLYMTYCVVCHGERGLGDGYVVPKFTKPPALTSRKLRTAPDGDLYHIITHGQNIMSGYSNQLQPMERWAVVHYIRALQRAEYPTEADYQRYQQTLAKP